MYLFYIDSHNYHPLGNDGTMHTAYKTLSYQRKAASYWLGNRRGSVYLMNDCTQEMCEMDMEKLVSHIRKNGKLLAYR